MTGQRDGEDWGVYFRGEAVSKNHTQRELESGRNQIGELVKEVESEGDLVIVRPGLRDDEPLGPSEYL